MPNSFLTPVAHPPPTANDPVAREIALAFGKRTPPNIVALIGGTPEDRVNAVASAPILPRSTGTGGWWPTTYQMDITMLLAVNSLRDDSLQAATSEISTALGSLQRRGRDSVVVIEGFARLLSAPTELVQDFAHLYPNVRVVAGVPDSGRQSFDLALQRQPTLSARIHRVEMAGPSLGQDGREAEFG